MKIKVNKLKTGKDIREVVINEASVQDIIEASRVSNANEGMMFMTALVAQICTFDGKPYTYEEVKELPANVFLELMAGLAESGVLPSDGLHSSLLNPDSTTPAS